MIDSIAYAIATRGRIERALTDAGGRAKRALAETHIELQSMLARSTPTAPRAAWPFVRHAADTSATSGQTIQTFVVDHAIILATLAAAFAFNAPFVSLYFHCQARRSCYQHHASICRKPLLLNTNTHPKAFVASGRDLVTFLLVCRDAADIGHEDTVFSGDIGSDIP